MADLTLISTLEIQTWLERTKLSIDTTEPDDLPQLETYAKSIVYGRLAQKFAVSDWINPSTTPSLVRQIIAMKVAAAVYRRQYSEDLLNDNNWAARLDAMADKDIECLIDGSLVLMGEVGITTTPSSLNSPAFYPTDISSAADQAPYFTISEVF